ncbi:MAG: hypothetical protein Q9157_000001 [Trypethelium eluteriae]
MLHVERVGHALGRPYKFQSSEDTIRQRLIVVHHRCDALFAGQVLSLQNLNEKIKNQNDEIIIKLATLEEENRDLKALQVSSRIAQLRNTLAVKELTHEEREDKLRTYELLLENSFSPPRRPFAFRISDLESAEEYKRWRAASAPVLVSRGSNHHRLTIERNS